MVIPEVIVAVNPADAVVTTDAMGNQKDIAWIIRKHQADYLLTHKDNHLNLY